jgi:hypothetical protein
MHNPESNVVSQKQYIRIVLPFAYIHNYPQL